MAITRNIPQVIIIDLKLYLIMLCETATHSPEMIVCYSVQAVMNLLYKGPTSILTDA